MRKHWFLFWFLVAALAACNGTSSPPAPPGAPIDMSAAAWQIRYSPGMPAQPSAASGGGWQFAFPSNASGVCPAPATQPPDFNLSPCHHVDYVTVPYASSIVAKSMVMTFDVVTLSPTYDYRTATNNTCTRPAVVRLLLEHSGDAALRNPVYRWWSGPSYRLDGSVSGAVISVPLTADQWSDVNGQSGSANAAAFADTLANVGAIGMTFGGGCFYGHGVYLDSGSATFVVTNFTLQ